MRNPDDPYYRHDLALVHHRGFAFHATACAPGILALLEPVRQRDGLVLELGCGSGLLTRELTAAGLRVIATDASPAMLEIAEDVVGDQVESLALLTMARDEVPRADAIVAIGHPISYLPDAEAVDKALIQMANALLPGGLLAIDICDLEWGRVRLGEPNLGRAGPDWAIVTEFSSPSADRYVRDMTTFVPIGDGLWRRDHEHHENVLVDTSQIPALLNAHGVEASIQSSFGDEQLPTGLRVIVGRRLS